MKTLDEFKREHARLAGILNGSGYLGSAHSYTAVNLLAELIAAVEAQQALPAKEEADEQFLCPHEAIGVLQEAISVLTWGESEYKVNQAIAALSHYLGTIDQFVADCKQEVVDADA